MMAKSLIHFLFVAGTSVLAAQQAVRPYGAGNEASADPVASLNATAGSPDVSSRIFRTPHSYCYKPRPTGDDVPVGNFTSGPTANVSSTTGAGPGSGDPTLAASDVTITQLLTSFTTVCPRPTQFAVNNVTYTVKSSTVITITDCPGGCRVTRAATDITQATVTAIVSRYTTSVGGPIADTSTALGAGPQDNSNGGPRPGTIRGPNGGASAGSNVGTTAGPIAGSDTSAGPTAGISGRPSAGPHAGYSVDTSGSPQGGVSAGPIAGPNTVTINGKATTVSKATVITVTSCPGGCTVTMAVSALVDAAQTPAEYAPLTSAAPNSGGQAAPAPYASPAASNGTIPLAAPSASAGPGRNANATVPVQNPQTGGATAKEFSFAVVLLAWVVAFL